MADPITPDNAVSFFQGLPRRVDEAAKALEDDTEGTVKETVTLLIDGLNRLIQEIQTANYGADADTSEASTTSHLGADLAARLRTGCTEVARGIAGVGQWEEAETQALLARIDSAVDEMSATLRQLQRSAERFADEQ